MISNAKTVEAYLNELPKERSLVLRKLRTIINANLPQGFEETMSYGMIGYVIPHSIYPSGYHVKPTDPVPFMALASQKNYVAVYYMGFMISQETLDWFIREYQAIVPTKLDMGKSCIRLKNLNTIPYDLIGELCKKITVESYLQAYDKVLEKIKK